MGGHSTGTPEFAPTLWIRAQAIWRDSRGPERSLATNAFLRTNRIHCQAERRIESVTAYADGVMGDMQEIPENVQSTVNSINREL